MAVLGLQVGLAGCECWDFVFPPSLPTSRPLVDEPIGGPCDTSADCANGINCVRWSFPNGGSTEVCSLNCDEGGVCPSGTQCQGAPTGEAFCLPVCSGDGGSECQIGDWTDWCNGSVCQPLSCDGNYSGAGGDSVCGPSEGCIGNCAAGLECVQDPSGTFSFCQAP
jgi:hypothetical protein